MSGLEANSPVSCGRVLPQRALLSGRIKHPSLQVLQRHGHDVGFVAVVLAGGYVEAGDTGMHRVGPGDVIVHQPYEGHLDRFQRSGAEVLTLPLLEPWTRAVRRRVADPDLISRVAERDRIEAAHLLAAASVAVSASAGDWPEMLAFDLLADPALTIRQWARERRFHPGSVARAFRQQFGITAAAFRTNARAHRALRDIRTTALPLADIAAAHGFADQAHMTRIIRAIAGHAPTRLRRLGGSR
jgi:AraC-like DNA-binding protein